MESKINIGRNLEKGVITLSLLIFLSGLLTLALLFDDDSLSFFRAQQMQRQNYSERALLLQKMMQQEKQRLCLDLPLNKKTAFRQVSTTLAGAEDMLQYSVWCRYAAIFKKTPLKPNNEGLLEQFVRIDDKADFKNEFASSSNPLVPTKEPQLYWFDTTQSEREVNGDVAAVIIAEGDLKLHGKGTITGTVITGGELTLDGVTIAYSKKVVTPLVQQYNKWQLAEKSWSDFKPQNE